MRKKWLRKGAVNRWLQNGKVIRIIDPILDDNFARAKNAIGSILLPSVAMLESDIVDLIEEVINGMGIDCVREKVIGTGSRIDLYLPCCRTGIEVKKGKPNTKAVAKQLRRYGKSDCIDFLIFVSERGLHYHIKETNGKPVHYISLSSNWGLTV